MTRERGVAEAAVRAAAEAIRSIKQPAVERKGSKADVITAADRAAEAALITTIRAAFPTDAIESEERGTLPGGSGRCWLLDPLDGTGNFAHGTPLYVVGLALRVDDAPVLALVYDVGRDELFLAERAGGATCNGRPAGVSAPTTLVGALVAAQVKTDQPERAAGFGRTVAGLLVATGGVRSLGTPLLSLAWVAAGRLEAFCERGPLARWDVLPGALLVTEAGGRVTGWSGGPVGDGADGVVASNGRVHAALLQVLNADG